MNDVSLNQVLKLWTELEMCMRGINTHNHNVCEIYAYTIMPYMPAWANGKWDGIFADDLRKQAIKNNQNLVHILNLFLEHHVQDNISIFIEDVPLAEWSADYEFRHRLHIKVVVPEDFPEMED